MKLVKIAAVLVVPLLLTSFLVVAATSYDEGNGTKTYKFEIWAVPTGVGTGTPYWWSTASQNYWLGNYTYDLYDGYPGSGGYLVGHKWIYCWGIQESDSGFYTAQGYGVYTITGNRHDRSFLGGNTGTFVLTYAGFTDDQGQLRGTFLINSGTGHLNGISGQGIFVGDDLANGYPHYLGTVTLPG